MKNIIESINKVIEKKPVVATTTAVVCNYGNNYYGDQVCIRR